MIKRCAGSLATALLVVLAACGTATQGPSATPASSGTPPARPVMITDCAGHQSTFNVPPQRVLTMDAQMLELAFWLGVQDRVVGTDSPPKAGTFPAQFDAAVQRVRRLGAEYQPGGSYKPISKEVLLGVNPDFVMYSYKTELEGEGIASQGDLDNTGIKSYLAFSVLGCETAQAPTGLDLVYRDLENLGKIFRVEDRAGALIQRLQSQVTDVQAKLVGAERPGVYSFEFDEGTEAPFAAGNRQNTNVVISLAGGRNVFGDVDKDYINVSWEEIVKRKPDVIMILIYDKGNPAKNAADFDKAKQFLRGFGPIQGLKAVQDQRFAEMLYSRVASGGVRNAEGVVELARQLHPDRVQ